MNFLEYEYSRRVLHFAGSNHLVVPPVKLSWQSSVPGRRCPTLEHLA